MPHLCLLFLNMHDKPCVFSVMYGACDVLQHTFTSLCTASAFEKCWVCLSESRSLQYDTFINTSTQYRLTVLAYDYIANILLQTTKNDAEEMVEVNECQ